MLSKMPEEKPGGCGVKGRKKCDRTGEGCGVEAGLGDARHQCRKEAEGKYHDSLFSYNRTPQIV